MDTSELLKRYVKGDRDFRKIYLRGANPNLKGASLLGIDLQGSTLHEVNLEGANLMGANLQETIFEYVNLHKTNLQGANFRESNLQKTKLLEGADLRKANLVYAQMQRVNLQVVVNDYATSITFEQAKEKIKKSIGQRQGQSRFRKLLLKAYKSCCAITGCEIEEALEAAHIIPYCLTRDNDPSNGLLLRADLHTLFDLNLIIIDPETRAIYLDGKLRSCNTYRELLHGTFLRQPTQTDYRRWREGLKWRHYEYEQFLD